MGFSDVHKQYAGSWSPDGLYLAAVAQNRVLVRSADTARLVQVFVAADRVERLEWSRDSLLLLAEATRQGVVHVWSIQDSEWHCKIDEGLAGVARARFDPSSQRVLVVSDFQIYLAVWQLDAGSGSTPVHIRHPKHSHRGLSFSHNDRWMALLQRSDCRDFLAVHSCEDDSFPQLTHVPVEGDIADLAWAPGDGAIMLWERPTRAARILWYSPQGTLLHQLHDCGVFRHVYPSPSGRLLATAGFDSRVHLVNGYGAARVLAVLTHSLQVACAEVPESEVTGLREDFVSAGEAKGWGQAAGPPESPGAAPAVRYVSIPAVARTRIPKERPSAQAPVDAEGMPRQGIGAVAWSADERWLVTRHDGMPTAAWVWDVSRLALRAILLHRAPVRSFSWDPSASARGARSRLALTTADALLFFWSPAEALPVPSPLSMARLVWRPDGRALLVQERERCCIFKCGSPAPSPRAQDDEREHSDRHAWMGADPGAAQACTAGD